MPTKYNNPAIFLLFLAVFAQVIAYAAADTAVVGGGAGVALAPYMSLQYPQHGHIFRRTTDIVLAVTVGNFTMPRDGCLMGFLNGCGVLCVYERAAHRRHNRYEIGPIDKAPEGHEPVVRLHLSLGELAEGR